MFKQQLNADIMGVPSGQYKNTVRPQNPFVQHDRNRNPLSVLIIGNGFDLDLGMHTSYRSFADSIYWPFNSLTHSCELGSYLNIQKNKENWFDLEMELAKYAQSTPLKPLLDEETLRQDQKGFNVLVFRLKEYLRSELQKYQKNAHDCKAKEILTEFSRKKNYFIHSFNYTDIKSISDVLKIHLNSHRIEYIHGSLKNSDIILGAGDNNLLPDKFDWLYKTSNNNYSANNLADSLANADEICIFGHSLGENDFDYFKPFFQRISQHMDLTYHNPETDKRLKLTIYTKDEESEIALKRQLRKLTDNHLQGIYANCDFKIEYTKP